MSNIDYHELDGGSPVARRNAGLGTKLGIAGIGLMLAGGLLSVNWPSGPSDRNATSNEDEAFEPSTFQPREPATPATALPPQDQIVIPPPPTPPPQQSAN